MSENTNNINNLNSECAEKPQNSETKEGGSEPKPTPDIERGKGETETVQAQLKLLEDQIKEKEQKYIYLYADFENYKKRAEKDRIDFIKYGWESLARELIQIIDNFDRALSFIDPAKTDKNLTDGLQMILKQFQTTLDRNGVKAIESLHKNFDPHFHEAVGQEVSTEHPEGTIMKELGRGYTLHGRLLRPAQVIVSKS